jgi:glycosyltransferase involved in cell wall biosynthesis
MEVPEGKHLLAYVGIMGPQDGIDVLLRSLAILFHEFGRTDAHAVLMGFGDSLESMRKLAEELNLTNDVTFTGRVDARTLGEVLSAATIGLGPDPSSPLNDLSTMNKTMEYMAYALPIVTFDLPETRASAGAAARYVTPGDERAFARTISDLLDDVQARVHLGLAARTRAVAELDWAAQRAAYLAAYERVTGYRAPTIRAATPPQDRRRRAMAPVDEWGRPFVDLRAQAALPEALRERTVV